MYDASKETNVRFMREAIKYLQEKILVLEKKNAEQEKLKQADADLCLKLSEELLILKKKFFCRGPEKKPNQAKKKRGKVNLVHNQPPFAKDQDGQSMAESLAEPTIELSEEEVMYRKDTPVCAHDQSRLNEMSNGFEESYEIDVIERRYILKRHRRQKYICPTCKELSTAAGPVKLTPGGEYSIHMGVQVANDKFHRHLPLERQCEMMRENGLQVDSKTLYNLTEHVAKRLESLPAMIKAEILAQKQVGIDESPMPIHESQGASSKVNHEEQQKKEETAPLSTEALSEDDSVNDQLNNKTGGKTNGYVWSISNTIGAYYQYESTRSGRIAEEMLAGYQGIVMADAYSGYDFLKKKDGIKLVHCWSHVRRKFHEAMTNYAQAEVMVDLIDKLYAIEHKADDFTALAELRKTQSTAVIAEILDWQEKQNRHYLESSSLGKAIAYMKNIWPQLTVFLSDAQVPLDNNGAERTQRRPVMGRNNFNGFKSINGADTAMTLYTIIESCRRLRLTPLAYMTEMVLRSVRKERLETPYQYAKMLHEQALKKVGGLPKEILDKVAAIEN